jgi:hypothetical protein
METIYRLMDREEDLRRMQEASLSHPFLGLKITHGLVGSQAWWDNIASGGIAVHSVRGVVRGLWLGMYNSEPGSFAMELSDRTWFRSMTMLEAAESVEKFTLGRFVETDYVIQELKSPHPGSTEPHKVVLEIRVDSCVAPNVEPIGPCYFTWQASGATADPPKRSVAPHGASRSPRWWQLWR